jgi:hypothetical protein
VVENIKMHELTSDELSIINVFLKSCEDYFNGNSLEVLENYKFHIVPTTEEMEERGIIPKVTFANQRGTDYSYRAFCKEQEGHDYLLFYVKIPFLLFAVEIISNEKHQWQNTELIENKIVCNPDTIEIPNIVEEIILTTHENKENAKKLISANQQKKIKERVEKEIKNNPNKIKSGSIIAMRKQHDI